MDIKNGKALSDFKSEAGDKSSAGEFIGPISKGLIYAVIEQIPNANAFIGAAAEVAKADKLAGGYDLFEDGYDLFFEKNQIEIMVMVEKLIKESESNSVFSWICNLIDPVIYPKINNKHIMAAISKSKPSCTESEEDQAVADAYDAIAYQLGSHCLMQTFYAYNKYVANKEVFYNIKCLDCKTHVDARYTTGCEVLPDDLELAKKNYWICDKCKHYVAGAGARRKYKGKKIHMPVGAIPNDEVKALRNDVYHCFNSLIELGLKRKNAYKSVSRALQYSLGLSRIFGVNQVNSLIEAEEAIAAILIAKKIYYDKLDKYSMRKTIQYRKSL